jgi:hypothetical protein
MARGMLGWITTKKASAWAAAAVQRHCQGPSPYRVEEVSDACCSQSHVHLNELTGAAADEGHPTLASNSTSHQRLAIT